MKVFVVSHGDEKSRVIRQIIDAVFVSKKDADEFISMVQQQPRSLLDFSQAIYEVNEVEMLDHVDWVYWRKQIKVEKDDEFDTQPY